MKIKYPLCGLPQLLNPIPKSFTAWGSYDTADHPTAGTCTLTTAGGTVVNGSALQFRSDGIWTSQINGTAVLAFGDICQVAASYTPSGGGNVPAPSQANLIVSPIAIAILPPAENADALFLRRRRAAPAPAPGAAPAPAPAPVPLPFPAGTAISLSGTYPPFVGIKDVTAVVHPDDINLATAYASATRGLVSLGQWTVLVPTPADHATVDYIVEILLLNQDGFVVRQGRTGL